EIDEQRDGPYDIGVAVVQRYGCNNAPLAQPATDEQIAHREVSAARDVEKPIAIVHAHWVADRSRGTCHLAIGVHHRRRLVLSETTDRALQSAATRYPRSGQHVGMLSKAGENLARGSNHADFLGRGKLRSLSKALLEDAHTVVEAVDRLQHCERSRREHGNPDD